MKPIFLSENRIAYAQMQKLTENNSLKSSLQPNFESSSLKMHTKCENRY